MHTRPVFMRTLRVWRALWACGRTVLRDGWRLVLSLLEKGSQALSHSLSASKDDPSLLRAGFFPGKFVKSLLGSRLAFLRRFLAWLVLADVFLLLIFLLHVYQPRGYVWELIPIGLGMVAPSFLLIFWRPLRDLLVASYKEGAHQGAFWPARPLAGPQKGPAHPHQTPLVSPAQHSPGDTLLSKSPSCT
jgi:hypothetical protein